MNFLYLAGVLLLLLVLGYPYLIAAVASRQTGWVKAAGYVLALLFTCVILLTLVLFNLDKLEIPSLGSLLD